MKSVPGAIATGSLCKHRHWKKINPVATARGTDLMMESLICLNTFS